MSDWARTTTTTTTATKHESDEVLTSLTTSFSRNHISQEATDIDTLQAQLRQALSHAAAAAARPNAQSQPPNTPTQTNPVSSFSSADSNGPRNRFGHRQRSSRSNTRSGQPIPGEGEDLTMIEEEREVEHILEHASPSLHPHPSHSYSAHPHIPPSSSFPVTDPFYASHLQAHQPRPVAPQSAFFSYPPN